MAQGFAQYLGKGIFESYSAGAQPASEVNPSAIQVMKEAHIDITHFSPQNTMALKNISFDYVVTLGCKDRCPFVPAHRHIEWNIEDPQGKSIETFRQARDQIRQKILELINKIVRHEL